MQYAMHDQVALYTIIQFTIPFQQLQTLLLMWSSLSLLYFPHCLLQFQYSTEYNTEKVLWGCCINIHTWIAKYASINLDKNQHGMSVILKSQSKSMLYQTKNCVNLDYSKEMLKRKLTINQFVSCLLQKFQCSYNICQAAK